MPAGERKSPTTIQYDEHDAVLYAKKTSLVSAATIYAVVNSGTGGTSSTDDAAFTVGTDAGTPFMALVDETSPDQADEGDVGVPRMTPNRILYTQGFSSATIYAVVNTAAAGQSSIVLDDSVASIGFATVNVVNTARSITGNVTLSDAKTYIGLTTSTLGVGTAGQEIKLTLVLVDSRNAQAAMDALVSSAGRAAIIEIVRDERTEIGIKT